MFRKNSKKKGMTLVELIIAIAILGIIMVSFLSMFTTGFIGIMNASKHTEAGYEAQKDMENSISSDPNTGAVLIEIDFPDGVTIDSTGKILEEEVDHDGRTINIKTFVPNP